MSTPISRRRFLASASAAAAGAGTAGVGWAGWGTGRELPSVERYTLDLVDLPRSFDGLRVLLASDVHAGAHMDEARMASVVRHLNSLSPDLVLLAGDMVDGRASLEDMGAFRRSFSGLRAAGGVLAVPGNHEHFAGVERACEELSRAGLTILRGEHRTLERAGDFITVVGIDDPQTNEFDPSQEGAVVEAISRAPQGFKILIAHRPAAFDTAAELGVSLTVAGHTHGGQVGLPIWGASPVRLLTRYVRGHYRSGEAHLVVSAGVGTGGMPLRIGVPPSVALITLAAA